MRGRRFIAVTVAAGGVLGFALPAAIGAEVASVRDLRAQSEALTARRHEALLGLYALESELARAQARVDALRARLTEVRAEHDSARLRLGVAKRTAAAAQASLAQQVRALYQHGEPDAIAVLLGADSLEEALTGLEGLQRSARQTDRVIRQARAARRSIRALTRTLSRREAELSTLAAAASERAAGVEAALAERRAYVERLASQQRLNRQEISALETQAQAAQERSARLETQRAALPIEAVVPVSAPVLQPPATTSGERTLTVDSTGYALPGTTASGLPVGWGIVAVDPAVIPLGTRMTIPGYGEGVAADTGSAVQGLVIDLWFPSTAQALDWGRRTVTITLH